jgi:hypothetical protein
MKQSIRIYIMLLAAILTQGCNQSKGGASSATKGGPASVAPALIDIPATGGPTTTPSSDPAALCANAVFLGRWTNNSNPAETWVFRSDCTGRNELCMQDFTYPSSLTGYNYTATATSSQLTTAECTPTSGIYSSTRIISWYVFSDGFAQINGNYHGAAIYTKVGAQ